MKKVKFYVCPGCDIIRWSAGDAGEIKGKAFWLEYTGESCRASSISCSNSPLNKQQASLKAALSGLARTAL